VKFHVPCVWLTCRNQLFSGLDVQAHPATESDRTPMPLKTAIVLLALLASSAAFAQTLTVDGCNIRRGTFCVNMNLNGAELPGANLANSQFSRSRLAGANLEGATLEEATL